MPWKSPNRPGSNYQCAKKLFLHLEQSLEVCPEKGKAFHDTHQKWVQQSFLEEVKDEPNKADQFFLPGFMVRRETMHGTSYRYVMNGAKTFEGKSLNDFLLPGPNKMNNLADVLVRFRENPYVLTCNVQNMFLGIRLALVDRDYLRVFYRSSKDEEIRVYRCTRHVFGLCSSPFVAMSTVLHHAQRNAHRWPLAHQLIRRNTIVDDILVSFRSEEETVTAKKELQALFGSMGLRPHKWTSNCSSVLEGVPEEEPAKAVVLDSGDWNHSSPCIRTLGVLWHSDVDAFQFVFRPEEPTRWTLRSLASLLGRLYDPPCWLSPVTVQGKELLQLAWQEQTSWDQPLPEILIKK